MSFGAPFLLLLLLALLPVAVALLALARWRRTAVRRLVAGAAGRASRTRRMLKAGLVLAALALLAVAAARPQHGSRHVLLPREGRDVMVTLDVSVSMLTADVTPNRFDRAKAILGSLLDRLPGDRVGLVVFAGNATLRIPLTSDIEAARAVIQSTTIKEGGLSAGTGIGDGIRVAATSFPTEDAARSKVMLVVSDGEDLSGSPLDAVRTARDKGVTVYTLGVGTAAGGEVVVPGSGGTPTPRIDPSTGQPATSRLDDALLRQLASAGGGRYFDGNSGDPAAAITDELDRLARTRFESQEGSIPIERFQWFAAAALALLLIDFLLPDTLRRVRTAHRPVRDAGRNEDAAA
jgi:Ca-activated chloride channel family protein